MGAQFPADSPREESAMKEHPTSRDLEDFLDGSASSAANRVVVRHLVAACTTCRASLQGMGWVPERLERIVSLGASDPEELPEWTIETENHDYDRAFERA